MSMAALLSVAFLASSAPAQSLDEAIQAALVGNCPRLAGGLDDRQNIDDEESQRDPLVPLPLGPELYRLCQFPETTGAASSAGGSVGSFTTGVSEEQRRVLRRLEQLRRQRGGGASADLTPLRGLGLFVAGEYEAFDKEITRFEPGYTSDKWGAVLGADYGFTPWLVAGVAFNYSNQSADFARRGGDFEIDSYGGLLYASVLAAPNLFIDMVGGYSFQDYSTTRRASALVIGNNTLPAGGAVVSDTDGNQTLASVNAGYDFFAGRVTIGPRAGLNYKRTEIDAFAERGSPGPTGLELRYERQVEESLTSVLGVFASLAFSASWGVIVPQATVEYVHEFLRDQRRIGFSFVQDPSAARFVFQNDPPDRDYFNAGVGVAAILPGGFFPFVNYRALLGYEDQTRHTVTVGLRVAF